MTPITYEAHSKDGLTIYADVSLPDEKGAHPLIVVLRGAAGGALDENGEYAHIEEHKALGATGAAICTVSHRGTPGRGTDFANMHDLGGPHIDDVIAIVNTIATMDQIDANNIILLGTSRGAFMAALCAGQYDLFSAAILVNGYYDLRAWFEFQEKHFGSESPLAQIIRPSWQALWDEFPIDERSPNRYAKNINCPLLLIHGEDDKHVPPQQSKDFHEYLNSLGKKSELTLIPAMAHSYPEDDDPAWTEVWRKINTFLENIV
jgi:phthiocerol/phenolphthiocerol synthesis type-I polyketide synthase C